MRNTSGGWRSRRRIGGAAGGERRGLERGVVDFHSSLTRILNAMSRVLASRETYQFSDYSVMNAAVFDVEAKIKWREEQSPIDRRKAFDMGVRLATAVPTRS